MSKVLNETRKGLDYLDRGQFKSAIKRFVKASSSSKGTDLQRAIANMFAYETAKYRREWMKKNFGNANLFVYRGDENAGKAWSDVDIGAVLMSPNTDMVNNFLTKFLGRSLESIRFQRRYAYGQPLMSWTQESGERYTRYTQTKSVADRLGT